MLVLLVLLLLILLILSGGHVWWSRRALVHMLTIPRVIRLLWRGKLRPWGRPPLLLLLDLWRWMHRRSWMSWPLILGRRLRGRLARVACFGYLLKRTKELPSSRRFVTLLGLVLATLGDGLRKLSRNSILPARLAFLFWFAGLVLACRGSNVGDLGRDTLPQALPLRLLSLRLSRARGFLSRGTLLAEALRWCRLGKLLRRELSRRDAARGRARWLTVYLARRTLGLPGVLLFRVPGALSRMVLGSLQTRRLPEPLQAWVYRRMVRRMLRVPSSWRTARTSRAMLWRLLIPMRASRAGVWLLRLSVGRCTLS